MPWSLYSNAVFGALPLVILIQCIWVGPRNLHFNEHPKGIMIQLGEEAAQWSALVKKPARNHVHGLCHPTQGWGQAISTIRPEETLMLLSSTAHSKFSWHTANPSTNPKGPAWPFEHNQSPLLLTISISTTVVQTTVTTMASSIFSLHLPLSIQFRSPSLNLVMPLFCLKTSTLPCSLRGRDLWGHLHQPPQPLPIWPHSSSTIFLFLIPVQTHSPALAAAAAQFLGPQMSTGLSPFFVLAQVSPQGGFAWWPLIKQLTPAPGTPFPPGSCFTDYHLLYRVSSPPPTEESISIKQLWVVCLTPGALWQCLGRFCLSQLRQGLLLAYSG